MVTWPEWTEINMSAIFTRDRLSEETPSIMNSRQTCKANEISDEPNFSIVKEWGIVILTLELEPVLFELRATRLTNSFIKL